MGDTHLQASTPLTRSVVCNSVVCWKDVCNSVRLCSGSHVKWVEVEVVVEVVEEDVFCFQKL